MLPDRVWSKPTSSRKESGSPLMSTEAQVEWLRRRSQRGRIDILVNIVGLYVVTCVVHQVPVEERQIMDVNVLSMFLTMRAVVLRMREQGEGGRVVTLPHAVSWCSVSSARCDEKRRHRRADACAREGAGRDYILVTRAPGLHDERRRSRASGGDRGAAAGLGCTHAAAGSGAGRRRRSGRVPLSRATFVTGQTIVIDAASTFIHPGALRPPGRDQTTGPTSRGHDIDRDKAYFGAASVAGRALAWKLEKQAELELARP